MSLKQFGGVFGRNPTFNDVTVEGDLILNGDTFTGLDYQGTWNASTNTPTLVSSTGTNGEFYIVSVAGATDLNGITNWGIGDWVMFNGSAWQRVEGGANGNFVDLSASGNVTLGDASTDTVTVNGYMGVGGSSFAGFGIYVRNTALLGGNQSGISSQIVGSSAAVNEVSAFRAQPGTAASAFTVTNTMGMYVINATKGAGSTITNQHGLYVSDQTQGTNNYGITSLVSSGSNKWNIYASGTANNAFAGNVRIGSTTAPTNALDITGAMTVSGNVTLGDASTDTVTVNGYMGVGGAGANTSAISVSSASLVGANQIGVQSYPVFNSSAVNGYGGAYRVVTEASAYTLSNGYGLAVIDASKGAGSTITNLFGIRVANQTQGTNNYGIVSEVTSGSNKWNIYASGTAANYFAGDVGIGTSSPTSIFGYAGLSLNGSVGGLVTMLDDGVEQARIIASASLLNIMSSTASGEISIRTGGVASAKERLRLFTTEAVFNDPGNDYDFRVESDTNTHAFFVDGGTGRIGVGTGTPLTIGAGYGELTLNGSQGGAVSFADSDVSMGWVGAVNDELRISTTTATGYVTIRTAAGGSGTERLRIKSTGQLRFVPLASDPAGAEAGDVYYNSSTNKLKVYNGTSWVDLH